MSSSSRHPSAALPARRRAATALAAAALVAVTATARSSSSSSESDTPTTSGASAGDGRDTQAACAAELAMSALAYPGGDPSGPAPTAAQVQQWAHSVEPHVKTLLANLPADLAGTVGPVLTRTLTEARAGRPLDDSDGSISAASTAIDRWVHDRCGYPMLDATTDGTALSGVPTSLPAGPLAISFTTTGDPTTAGFALLLGKVKDGQTVTAADVQSGRAGFEQVTDIVGAAGPGVGARPGYSVTTLTAGRYIVASPLGSPPTFTGLLAVELTVR